jgi:hypothetical protein
MKKGYTNPLSKTPAGRQTRGSFFMSTILPILPYFYKQEFKRLSAQNDNFFLFIFLLFHSQEFEELTFS